MPHAGPVQPVTTAYPGILRVEQCKGSDRELRAAAEQLGLSRGNIRVLRRLDAELRFLAGGTAANVALFARATERGASNMSPTNSQGAALLPIALSATNRANAESFETPWMTIRQLAGYLSVSVGTVRNWVSRRYVPFARRGRVVRFNRQQIDQWLGVRACPGRLRPAAGVRSSSRMPASASLGGTPDPTASSG